MGDGGYHLPESKAHEASNLLLSGREEDGVPDLREKDKKEKREKREMAFSTWMKHSHPNSSPSLPPSRPRCA